MIIDTQQSSKACAADANSASVQLGSSAVAMVAIWSKQFAHHALLATAQHMNSLAAL